MLLSSNIVAKDIDCSKIQVRKANFFRAKGIYSIVQNILEAKKCFPVFRVQEGWYCSFPPLAFNYDIVWRKHTLVQYQQLDHSPMWCWDHRVPPHPPWCRSYPFLFTIRLNSSYAFHFKNKYKVSNAMSVKFHLLTQLRILVVSQQKYVVIYLIRTRNFIFLW